MGEIDLFAAGVDDDEQAVVTEIGDHQVVDDAAPRIGQQGVALTSGLQPLIVAAHQAFQAGRGPWAVQHGLTHVRGVEQSRFVAAKQMLGHNAAFAAFGELVLEIVLDRHGIAREGHHAGAMMAVPVFEGGRL